MTADQSTLPTGMAALKYPITQISLAIRDLDKTMPLYYKAFGWAPWQVFDHVLPIHHNTELRGQKVHYALRGAEVYVGAMNFELLEPIEGPNLWTEFTQRRGEGIASIATMFHERVDGDAVKRGFKERFGINVNMKADIGDHIEYYYVDSEKQFGCLLESGSGHAIDFVKPAQVYPRPGAQTVPSPMSGIVYPLTQVTLVARTLDAKVKAFHDAFGWGPWKFYKTGPGSLRDTEVRGKPAAFDIRWAQTRVGEMNFEIIEPLGGGASPWHAFLAGKGEGLCSISVTLRSPEELKKAIAQFGELGVGVLASGRVGDAGPWCCLDSEAAFKCMIQCGLSHAYEAVPPERVSP